MRAPALRVVSLGTFCLLYLSLSPSAFAQNVSVTSATPNNGPQGTLNLNVVIAGKGFAKGARAAFYLTGTTNPAGIAVNSTTFSGATQVTANINIADTATISSFDIVVTNTTGRSGKGIKSFAVIQTNSSSRCTAPPVTLSGPVNCASGSTASGCLDNRSEERRVGK